MFEVDSFQERFLDDEDDKKWLLRVLKELGESEFPYLKDNLQNNNGTLELLDRVIQDAHIHGFIYDNELLVRYAIYAINRNKTPLEDKDLRLAIQKSETIKLGIIDQIALADWALRMYIMFDKDVRKET